MDVVFDGLCADLRLAGRGLRRAAGFSILATGVLAVGVAAAAVMLAIVRGAWLAPLPVASEDSLIVAWKDLPASGMTHHPFGAGAIDDVARNSRLLEAVAGVDANGTGREAVDEDGTATYVSTALVTGRFFEVLGVRPRLGRTLGADDDVEGAAPAVVISSGFWQRRYGGAPDALGRRVAIAGQTFTIVGVMPAGLDYPRGVELWRPARTVPVDGPFGDAARQEIDLVARLRPGVSREQAAAELVALTRHFERTAPAGASRGLVPVVQSLDEAVSGAARPWLIGLTSAVLLIVLVAVANVAGLLLLRVEERRSDLAVHQALGAGWMRIVRQVLLETIALAAAGALIGLLIASWGLPGLLALVPGGVPRLDLVALDGGTVGLLVCGAGMMAGVIGILAATIASRGSLAEGLRDAGRGAGRSAGRLAGRLLVMAQTALVVVVLVAAGTLLHHVRELSTLDTGLAAAHLLVVDLAVPPDQIADRPRHERFLERAVARLEALPGVVDATPVNAAPFSEEGGWDVPRFTAEGQSHDQTLANPALNLETVHPNYFGTLGVTLRRGRAFVDADRADAPLAVIVSEDVAARVWPGHDPIGRRIKFGGPDSAEPWRTVVGVAAPTRYRELEAHRPTLYIPAAQFLDTGQRLIVRTTATPAAVSSLARTQLRDLDPGVRVMRVEPFSALLGRPLARPRFSAMVMTIFAAAGLLLSGVGLFAAMTAFVRRHDRDIALRMALGATPAGIRRLVLGELRWLTIAGLGVGLVGVLIAAPWWRTIADGTRLSDPGTLLGGTTVVVTIAVVASLAPLRRATRIDPIALLKR